jgi:hypothetical protein
MHCAARFSFAPLHASLAVLLCSASAVFGAKPARVVLPQKLVTGQPATLAVVDEDGRLLEGVTVTFTGSAQVTTDETGRAVFTAPAQQGVLFAEARNSEGRARASAVVTQAPAQAADGLSVADAPALVALGSEFVVSGYGFRGEADANQVTLGGSPAIVLAASPSALVIVPPDVQAGPADLRFEVGRWTVGPIKVTLVALEVAAAPPRVAPGRKGKLLVRARGIDLPVEIAVLNQTPEILELPQGETRLRVHTRGGAENSAVIEVKGRREGDFAVEVRLVPAASGLPDTVLAHRELTTAQGIATGEIQKTLARLLRHLEEHPQHYLDVRNELEKLLAELPRGELLLHVEAAWRVLLRK